MAYVYCDWIVCHVYGFYEFSRDIVYVNVLVRGIDENRSLGRVWI